MNRRLRVILQSLVSFVCLFFFSYFFLDSLCLLCPPLGKEFLSLSKLTKKNTSRWRWKTKTKTEKYGNYLLGSPWFVLFFLFVCFFAFEKGPIWQSNMTAQLFLHKELFTQLPIFSPSFSIPSNPPPLPSLSLCLNSPLMKAIEPYSQI